MLLKKAPLLPRKQTKSKSYSEIPTPPAFSFLTQLLQERWPERSLFVGKTAFEKESNELFYPSNWRLATRDYTITPQIIKTSLQRKSIKEREREREALGTEAKGINDQDKNEVPKIWNRRLLLLFWHQQEKYLQETQNLVERHHQNPPCLHFRQRIKSKITDAGTKIP